MEGWSQGGIVVSGRNIQEGKMCALDRKNQSKIISVGGCAVNGLIQGI